MAIGLIAMALCSASPAFAATAPAADGLAPAEAAAEKPLAVAQVEPATINEQAAVKPVAEVKAEGGKTTETDEKWWSLTFTYELAHNVARERPMVNNAFALDPGFTLPYEISLGFHLGFFVTTEYPGDGIGARDVTVNTVDMDPIVATLSRKFTIDEKYSGFSITPSFGLSIPYVSRFNGQATQYYAAIKPGVTFGVAKWGFSLSNANTAQKNFHGDAYIWRNSEASATREATPLNEWTYANTTSLRYSFWKMSLGLGFTWARSWRYHPSNQEQAINKLSYSGDIGIEPYDGLSVTLGVATDGPERRNGGFKDDYTKPLDPLFTNVFLSLSYTI
ncbi:MAG: hypothetical protein C4523_09355 [Myxococcales bacterium]|nr:MAG: hypothetical protein C4523_09355 [Myxococcales bacterium]